MRARFGFCPLLRRPSSQKLPLGVIRSWEPGFFDELNTTAWSKGGCHGKLFGDKMGFSDVLSYPAVPLHTHGEKATLGLKSSYSTLERELDERQNIQRVPRAFPSPGSLLFPTPGGRALGAAIAWVRLHPDGLVTWRAVASVRCRGGWPPPSQVRACLHRAGAQRCCCRCCCCCC